VDPVTGEAVKLEPEFAEMSRRPGIGYQWFRNHWTDVYAARDGIVVSGKVVPAPRYYDKKLEEIRPYLMRSKREVRALVAWDKRGNRTPYHLAASEAMAKSLQSMRKDKL
jgi:hypothetical protein